MSSTSTPAIAKSMDAQALRAELTTKYATDKFAMEYDGYLSNHLLHGVVALFELGASAAQIDDFADYYARQKLEAVAPNHEDPFDVAVVEASADSGTNENDKIPSAERLAQLLGKREDFDALLAYYGREVKLLGTDGAVRKHLPHLLAGLCGALLHGLIQLGYAYHIGGDRLIAEGLAYMHFSYLSFEDDSGELEGAGSSESKRAFSREELLSAVHALKHHEFVLSEMEARLPTKAIAELPLGLFQRKLNALSAHPERGSRAAFQSIASALDQFDLSQLNGDVALDFSLWLYDMIAHNDFVIAHAVTSAWSLKQLEHLLDEKHLARAWKVWLHVAVTAFILQDVRDLSDEDVCSRASQELSGLQSWEEIIASALALEGYQDEHLYKVVQVALDHAGGIGGKKSSFLSDEEREFVTRSAAVKVVALDFSRI